MLFESTFVRSAGILGAFYRIASTFTKDNTSINPYNSLEFKLILM